MTQEKINELVKKLEPLFLGFKASENRLKNDNGMELVFRLSWNNKTTVSGLHATHTHSIGCSFEKPIDKIHKDVRRRLMTAYYADFFATKRAKQERLEHDEQEKQKLRAIASVVGGEVINHYGLRGATYTECVSTEDLLIYQTYNGLFEVSLKLDYIKAMKMAPYLKTFFAEKGRPVDLEAEE